jgi:hypothetical protein
LIHLATVHWQSDRWVDIQHRYLERYLDRPYRLYAVLDEGTATRADRFDFHFMEDKVEPANKTEDRVWHSDKLNFLSRRIGERAAADDILVFIDGDAFPIAPLGPAIERLLSKRPLAAIRRDENLLDPQPHPAFCVTTVGFWQEIEGDWSAGYQWQVEDGSKYTDVGGNLLKLLEERGLEWTPLTRTNKVNLHPLLFGVYADLVYHHGAGFRISWTRRDQHPVVKTTTRFSKDIEFRRMWRRKVMRGKLLRNKQIEEQVFERIKSDDQFWRHLFYEG